MLNKLSSIVIFCALSAYSFGQDLTLPVEIKSKAQVKLNTWYQSDTSIIKVTKWQCYLGHFTFYYQNGDSTYVPTYKLISIEDSTNRTQIKLENVQLHGIKRVKFQIGVDSVQFYKGVFEGDLDPGNGMFWAWNSGYINFKLEYEDTLLNEFQYHIGGYASPYNTITWVDLSFSEQQEFTGISFDLDKLLTYLRNNNMPPVMSPGKNAQKIALFLPQCFNLIKEEE